MKILLRVRYDGAHYSGFQVQPGTATVQQKLNEACRKAFGCDCDISGCSRTDSGVHALEFVCSVKPRNECGFSEKFSIPEEKFTERLGDSFRRIFLYMVQHLLVILFIQGIVFQKKSIFIVF